MTHTQNAEQVRAAALASLAAAIERAIAETLPMAFLQAAASDPLTERLLERNIMQLADATGELRTAAAAMARHSKELAA